MATKEPQRRYMSETLSMPGVDMDQPDDPYLSRTLSMPGVSMSKRPAQEQPTRAGTYSIGHPRGTRRA